MQNIRDQVLAQLAREPKTHEQLLEALTEIESSKQLSNCLYTLRTAGDIVRLDDKSYAITASATPAAQTYIDTHRPIGATVSVVAPVSKKQARVVFAEVAVKSRKARALKDIAAEFNKPRPALRAILEKSVNDNQAALDDYVASVADPRILGPLRNARDQARAAVAALDAMENKP